MLELKLIHVDKRGRWILAYLLNIILVHTISKKQAFF